MSGPVHFEVEVFYETKVGPACGYDAPGDLTDDHANVTCVECRKLCGFPLRDIGAIVERDLRMTLDLQDKRRRAA